MITPTLFIQSHWYIIFPKLRKVWKIIKLRKVWKIIVILLVFPIVTIGLVYFVLSARTWAESWSQDLPLNIPFFTTLIGGLVSGFCVLYGRWILGTTLTEFKRARAKEGNYSHRPIRYLTYYIVCALTVFLAYLTYFLITATFYLLRRQ